RGHRERHRIVAGIAACTCVRDLIQMLEDGAPVHVPREIRHVRRHENRHGKFVAGGVHASVSGKSVARNCAAGQRFIVSPIRMSCSWPLAAWRLTSVRKITYDSIIPPRQAGKILSENSFT